METRSTLVASRLNNYGNERNDYGNERNGYGYYGNSCLRRELNTNYRNGHNDYGCYGNSCLRRKLKQFTMHNAQFIIHKVLLVLV